MLAGMAQMLRLGEPATPAPAELSFIARSRPRLALLAAANPNWEQQRFLIPSFISASGKPTAVVIWRVKNPK